MKKTLKSTIHAGEKVKGVPTPRAKAPRRAPVLSSPTSAKQSANKRSPILPSATNVTPSKSTARNVLRHATGWAGDDLESIISTVGASRAKSRF